MNEQIAYLPYVRWMLEQYAQGKAQDAKLAFSALSEIAMLQHPIADRSDPILRHYMAYLRWYAAGNQDGGACARVALEIAG